MPKVEAFEGDRAKVAYHAKGGHVFDGKPQCPCACQSVKPAVHAEGGQPDLSRASESRKQHDLLHAEVTPNRSNTGLLSYASYACVESFCKSLHLSSGLGCCSYLFNWSVRCILCMCLLRDFNRLGPLCQ